MVSNWTGFISSNGVLLMQKRLLVDICFVLHWGGYSMKCSSISTLEISVLILDYLFYSRTMRTKLSIFPLSSVLPGIQQSRPCNSNLHLYQLSGSITCTLQICTKIITEIKPLMQYGGNLYGEELQAHLGKA